MFQENMRKTIRYLGQYFKNTKYLVMRIVKIKLYGAQSRLRVVISFLIVSEKNVL